MRIRQALRRQSFLASGKLQHKTPSWCGSNAILAMMVAIFAIILAVKALNG